MALVREGLSHAVLGGLLGASFYGLFAVFPDRSPLERRAPWLKGALLAAGLVFGFSGIREGEMALPGAVAGWLAEDAARRLAFGYGYGLVERLQPTAMVIGLVEPSSHAPAREPASEGSAERRSDKMSG